MPDPRPPQLALLGTGHWPAVMAVSAENIPLGACPAVVGGVELFRDGASTARRVLLRVQKPLALNGLYETVPVGPNLLSNLTLPSDEQDPPVAVAVTPGQVYRYVHHSFVDRLQNVGQELTASGDFVAQGSTVYLYPSAAGLTEDVLATLRLMGLARTSDADSIDEFGAASGGKRVEVLEGDGAGIWEFGGTAAPFVLGTSTFTFTQLGRPAPAAPDTAAAGSAIAPEISDLGIVDDNRAPQTAVPPKSGVDAPTSLPPSLPLLGIRGVLTIQSAPVTVGGELVICLF